MLRVVPAEQRFYDRENGVLDTVEHNLPGTTGVYTSYKGACQGSIEYTFHFIDQHQSHTNPQSLQLYQSLLSNNFNLLAINNQPPQTARHTFLLFYIS
jgi:hypothetical protein